jgi:tetratricopeptide (TPR) repeat protein
MRLRKDDSKPGDEHAKRGVRALQRGEDRVAIYELQKAIRLGSTYYKEAELYTRLAKAYERINEFEKSVDACQKALEIDPQNHRAWHVLATTYYYFGKLDRSEECDRRALTISPDYAPAHAGLGAISLAREQPGEAAEHLRQAIALDPRMGAAHGNLALALAMRGQYDDARATLKRAVAFGYAGWRRMHERIEALEAYESLRVRENVRIDLTDLDFDDGTPWVLH